MAASGFVSISGHKNAVCPLDRHVLPTLPCMLDSLGQSIVMSTLDLTSGYHQVELEEGSRDMTTFLTPKGK